MFAFKTAKHWGRGPPVWTADALRFTIPNFSSPPSNHSTTSPSFSRPRSLHNSPNHVSLPTPPTLCRWSVHCSAENIVYENDDDSFKDRDPPEPAFQDPTNESTWQEWPNPRPEFSERLAEGIQAHDFSTVDAQEIPSSVSQMVQVAVQDPHSILEETLGFAICASNHDLVNDVLSQMYKKGIKCSRIYPLHLATSFLDGAKSCCLILESLLQSEVCGKPSDQNEIGYNCFDSLMITILRSHTTLTPEILDTRLKKERRFQGEEIDICGRWSADTECYRQLLSSGVSTIPPAWKHKFCHTSIQTIYHCLKHMILFENSIIDEPCWLFTRRCEHCGMKLELPPLYIAVIVAVYLAEYSFVEEDLFGMLAIVMVIIDSWNEWQMGIGDDLFEEYEREYLPLGVLFSSTDSQHDDDKCHHYSMTISEFAESLPESVWQHWTPAKRTSWRIICHVLQKASSMLYFLRNEDKDDLDICGSHERIIVESRMAALHAAIKVELLTYRRLQDNAPWISENFDIEAVLRSFESQSLVLSAGLITDVPLMNGLCKCGCFCDWPPNFETSEHACAFYFSNLGDNYELCNIISPTHYELELSYL
jgi:hypothetical protein